MKTLDLRSDTVTRPTPAMREAMSKAEVGDDVYFEDPTVNRLQAVAAELLGKQAALFVPSGTMANQAAIAVHTRPGDVVLAGENAHALLYEGGAASALSGVQIQTLGSGGLFDAGAVLAAIHPDEQHYAPTTLVTVENTHNVAGGVVFPLDEIRAIADAARERGLALHMDGARLLNAVVASGVPARDYAEPFDSVWIDLSKGLGCPVGAVVAGSSDLIKEAWRWKQRMGGAMRQAGFLAAAGLYALENHVERLAEDHENARLFGEMVSQVEGVSLPSGIIETNIVFVDISGTGISAPELSAHLEELGINIGAFDESILRAVTHLDVNQTQVAKAGQAFVIALEEIGSP
jgi:threonine aldolase